MRLDTTLQLMSSGHHGEFASMVGVRGQSARWTLREVALDTSLVVIADALYEPIRNPGCLQSLKHRIAALYQTHASVTPHLNPVLRPAF